MTIATKSNRQAEQFDVLNASEQQQQQYQRTYHRKHRVRLAAQRRARYKQNPAPYLLAARQWVAKNRERRRQYQKAWYQKKLQQLRLQHRAAYARHLELERARSRAYYDTHRAAVCERLRRYYKRKVAAKKEVIPDGL
jgi:hypothetical protein